MHDKLTATHAGGTEEAVPLRPIRVILWSGGHPSDTPRTTVGAEDPADSVTGRRPGGSESASRPQKYRPDRPASVPILTEVAA
jgi:hypothetical protein